MGMCKHGSTACKMCHGGMMAEGGLVDLVMTKRKSLDDTPPVADSEEADYDVLADDDDMAADDTGANSGDEDGEPAKDMDDSMVSRAMMKRKKGSMPRPA